MLYSQILGKTNKNAKEFDSVNATLLQKAGFIDQTMAGVYTFLPLGLRVLTKIEDIIRKEMDEIGSELLMPSISPTNLWEQTGRLETVDVLFKVEGANEPSKKVNDATYILNPTHEDVLTPIAKKFNVSYKDLPFAVFQIQSKFRNEPRPKSGLMRGREFRMKDLYSFHASEDDLNGFYEKVKGPYKNIFKNLGLGNITYECFASGGDFTDSFSHEYQTVIETGEDTIYLDKKNNIAYNKEIVNEENAKKLDVDFESLEVVKASEVGNIFPLGTKFADAINYTYTDAKGEQKPVWMGSYGIGSSRIMGVLVEVFNDENGILWPENVAPFKIHLVGLNLDNDKVLRRAQEVYEKFEKDDVEVLFDDRPNVSPGEKLTDADLIGCPYRVVVSEKTGDKIEVKKRESTETSLTELTKLLKTLQ